MSSLVSGPAFARLFDVFAHSAFRLEVRDRYNVPGEQADLERWLRTGEPNPDEEEQRAPWLHRMRTARAAGKRIERVRVVSEPLSDYIRFELAGTVYNARAGEDIRYLPRHHPVVRELPGHDYWLFDSSRLGLLHFSVEDEFLGLEWRNDAGKIVEHCRARDAAWHYAIPYEDYAPGAPG